MRRSQSRLTSPVTYLDKRRTSKPDKMCCAFELRPGPANGKAPEDAFEGGAISGGGNLTVTNSTFVNNSAFEGGAISNNGNLTVTNSTFARNLATANGGAISSELGTVTVSDSIFHKDSAQGVCAVTTDGGYNLNDDEGSVCGFTAGTDILNTDPRLGPLANNGGHTQTMALSPTSPAIDAVPVSSNTCPKTDQRGVTRPDNGESSCDIGAYEFGWRPDPVTLRYTGPRSIKRGNDVLLSARLTARNGGPIGRRVLRIQIGRGYYTQICRTQKTDTNGQAGCLIKDVAAWKSPTPVKARFDGDPTCPKCDYLPGYKSTPVIIVR